MRKLWWLAGTLLVMALFRHQLLSLIPYEQEGISTAALLIAIFGGLLVGAGAYALVTGMEMRAVSQVASVVTFGGILCSRLGHWLVQFPAIGDFWGGFVAGILETCILWGALYGAKEVWAAKSA